MKHPLAFALLTTGSLLSAVLGRAATLEYYFDFTKCGEVAAGSAITSNIHGRVSATVKEATTALKGEGLLIAPGNDAGGTGVVLPADALGVFTGDFTLQLWYRTGAEIGSNTLLYGGTTSEFCDNSVQGDQALFTGYNNRSVKARFLRPITSDGSRWGVDMADTSPGTGMEPNTLYDYVLTYDSGARLFSAYMDGVLVGTMPAGDFAGLPALAKGFAVGGVQNSAFAEDKTAGVTIASFLMYRGALASSEVARIHAFGADLTVVELAGAGVSLAGGPPSVTTMETPPVAASASDRADAERAASRAEGAPLRRHRR